MGFDIPNIYSPMVTKRHFDVLGPYIKKFGYTFVRIELYEFKYNLLYLLPVFGWSIVGFVVIQTIFCMVYYLWIHREYPFSQVRT